MITTRVDTSKTSEDLSLLKCINIWAILGEMKKSFFSPRILTTHPTLKDRILEREWEYHFARLSEHQSDTISVFGKSSLFELSIHTKKHLQSKC
jgi:hypothetical protein